jgi:hypothetical protein
LTKTTVEACGFGTTEASCHNYTISDFCEATPYAEQYNGGLAGAPAGLFSYFNLALYWAPSSCRQAGQLLHLWHRFTKSITYFLCSSVESFTNKRLSQLLHRLEKLTWSKNLKQRQYGYSKVPADKDRLDEYEALLAM